VYANTKNDPPLKGKVKVVGIAVGNTENEIKQYNKEFKVSYPVLTDYSFAVHRALGNVRVPFTIFVKRDMRGRCVVVATHQGVYDSAEEVMKTLQTALR
jgi:peroxiredoxin